MIKVDNLTPPSAKQFNVVTAGIRNAFKSYDRADSELVDIDEHEIFAFGENDKKLANTLIGGDSPSHRKFLRQLPLVMDITAPLYFWKQLDTYKVGTTANSESTMHCLTKNEFKLKDFSFDTHNPEAVPLFININAFNNTDVGMGFEFMDDEFITSTFANDNLKMEIFEYELLTIKVLNYLRKLYLETGDKSYWNYINELLPQSYLQKRTWTANYEVVLTIINQRIHHKLPEWRNLIIYWLTRIPYLYDFALADGVIKLKDSDVVINDTEEFLFSVNEIES